MNTPPFVTSTDAEPALKRPIAFRTDALGSMDQSPRENGNEYRPAKSVVVTNCVKLPESKTLASTRMLFRLNPVTSRTTPRISCEFADVSAYAAKEVMRNNPRKTLHMTL